MLQFANQQMIYALSLYGIIVIVPYFVFCKLELTVLNPWKVDLKNSKSPNSQVIKSTLTSLVVLYVCLFFGGLLKRNGILVFQENHPQWYYVISFPLIVLIHDAYFYWTHYLMHKSKFLYQFHKMHHLGHETTPLDVYAFHPVEAFVHFIFFIIYPLVIPTDLTVIQFMFVWMLVCNSAGHLSYEFYPKFLYKYPIIKQFNTATHHLMHHKHYNSNYSLYYNWWDRWMGTNHKNYFETFKKIKENTELELHSEEDKLSLFKS